MATASGSEKRLTPEQLERAVKEVTFIVDDAKLRASSSGERLHQVLYLGPGDARKNSLRGATRIIVSDLDGRLTGAVQRHDRCPHWYQQAPPEKIVRDTLYATPQAALSALDVDVEL